MKIAQIAPLYESVPPKLYGGTERIVSYLTEELVKQGHEVTLFASGDSKTRANLVSVCSESLRLCETCIDPIAYSMLLIEQVAKQAGEFDIIHSHIDYFYFPLARRIKTPTVTTLHGRLDLPDLIPLYKEYRDMPVVSISDSQRIPLSFANWRKTIYHGIPKETFTFKEKPSLGDEKYLAFLGRVSPEKRLDRAISIAKECGIKLKVAAKVDKADREYFETLISPLLRDNPSVEFIGEVGGKDKDEFLGNAYGLLFPIDWPEPFGLVMIEAMACGTPVIAYPHGSVPEVMQDGVTGYIVRNENEAVEAVAKLDNFDRKQCRQAFEERFDVTVMAKNYLELYEQILNKSKMVT
jgi:glycosyltransferase involved in cell wall biosynthesis